MSNKSHLTDYFRIFDSPRPSKTHYMTSDYMTIAGTQYTGQSWYMNLMRGSSSRLQQYVQFSNMDNDVDICKALDTIAEEMTTTDEDSDMPLVFKFFNDDNKEIDEGVIITLKAALRHWVKRMGLDTRTFQIARNTIKYGDCFFRKVSEFKKWIPVPPGDVIGVEVDDHGNIVSYHIRKGSARSQSMMENVEVVPATAMVHFSLSTEMDDSGPFGIGILSAVTKSFKQLTLLEDSVIIYRIARAPERRIFYLDTGNLPPQKQKAYIEAVKNEFRQKQIANMNTGDNVDGVYNPTSILEDYFFAVNSNGRGAKVETLPGGENLGEINDLKYFQDKVFRGLKIPTSYMRGADAAGAQANDGKVGIAYIEEMRFSNYVQRLQNKLEPVFDQEFKKYIKSSNLNIDTNLFSLSLCVPQNFAAYRQAQLDSELINTFNTADGVKYLSKRFVLRRYLGYNEEDIQINEALLRQERGIPEGGVGDLSDIQMMYDEKAEDERKVVIPKVDKGDEASAADEEDAGDDFSMDGLGAPEEAPEEAPAEAPAETPATPEKPSPEIDTDVTKAPE